MKIKINIPTTWDELSQKQLEKITYLFSTVAPGVFLDILVFKTLLNIKWWQFIRKARIRYVLSDVPMSELRKNFVFLYQENKRTKFEPTIKVGKKTYYGPMDRIIDLTADEFAVADALHIAYRKTQKREYLQNLFHVLYTETEDRPVFDKLKLPKLINNKVPLTTLMAVEVVFSGCKNHIANKFKKAFSGSGESKKSNNASFEKIIVHMAKGDLSKLKTIENVNIYKFLTQFQDDIEVYNKSKAKAK